MAGEKHTDRLPRRSVLKALGAGAIGSAATVATTGSVSADSHDATLYENPVYGPHFPDPTIHRAEDGTWWAYGTNMDRFDDPDELLVTILRSDDLVNWTFVGEAFESRPGWTYGSIWAPDVHYYNGEWVLFYALEPRPWESGEFGIGLAKADTPDGPFTDYGQVIGDFENPNGGTIDAYFVEYQGTPYLFFGSFQGIYVVELTPDLQDWVRGSMRQLAGDAYEGANVFYRDGYWYLFLATGTCCYGYDSTYEVAVGRSTDFFGPYLDRSGTDLMAYNEHNDGIAHLTANDRFVGPAHGDVTVDDDGNYWFVYHGYDREGPEFIADGPPARQFFVDRIWWTDDGWPVIGGDGTPSAQARVPNAGDEVGPVSEGTYRIRNLNSDMVLEAEGGGTSDGTTVVQGTEADHARQEWILRSLGNWEYVLENANSGKVLEAALDGEATAPLGQWPWNGHPAQRWYVVENDDGTSRLENVASGLVADVLDFSTEDGAAVIQWSWLEGDNQRWTFEAVDQSEQLPTLGDNEGPPRDLDGDGRHRDVNGNGRLDFDDVVTYFEHMADEAVQENVSAFDFNGNGGIDFQDVVALFESL